MKLHELKIREDFADAIITGDKTFELRYNDRGYQKGDRVRFKAWKETKGDSAEYVDHEIDGKEYEITYVLNGWGLKNEFVAFAVKEVSQGNENHEVHVPDKAQKKEKTTTKRTRIDHRKIRALKNAGWSNKDIADEMHMTTAAVANSLSTHKELIEELKRI